MHKWQTKKTKKTLKITSELIKVDYNACFNEFLPPYVQTFPETKEETNMDIERNVLLINNYQVYH